MNRRVLSSTLYDHIKYINIEICEENVLVLVAEFDFFFKLKLGPNLARANCNPKILLKMFMIVLVY